MRYKIDTSDKLAVKTKYLFHIEYKMGKMCDIQSIVKTTKKNIFILIPNKDKADIILDNKTNIIIRWVRVRAMVFSVTLLAERTTYHICCIEYTSPERDSNSQSGWTKQHQ